MFPSRLRDVTFMLSKRRVLPEILDHLAPDDPQAVRSRRDLRWIDKFLGNSRWICRILREWPKAEVLELGAGEGKLLQRIHRSFPSENLQGMDLAPRPTDLPERIGWEQGDFLRGEEPLSADVVVCSLVLHHFEERELAMLGQRLSKTRVLVICEPWRHRLPLVLAHLAFPLAGAVTRHDMPVSIRAGFRSGELARVLGLHPAEWKIREKCLWRGSVRMLACRRA